MRRWLVVLAACAGPDVAGPTTPMPPVVAIEAPPLDAAVAPADAPPADAAPVAPEAEVWLRGSTHVHAKPSGDSSEPILSVVAWYEAHHYDFIALTDHNQVSEVDGDTTGQVAVRAPASGLIVLAGMELTHNPSGCLPPGDKSKKCRIHVNALGPTVRPGKKLEWANRKTHDRVEKYQAALDTAKALGAVVVQLNHPQWYWGMTADVLIQLAHRGVRLVEIANAQFTTWNAGDKDHPSMEALWDAALIAGATLWGVASDDAHDYSGSKRAKWPPGGGWIVVHARRDPRAILDAITAGHFYASNGVELLHAEATGGELVVEVAASDPGDHKIAFIESGKVVETVAGRTAKRAVPAHGYVRAVVTRGDGKQAWVQPARP